MEMRVRLFALARQLAGRDTIVLDLPQTATVRDVRAGLIQECPALSRVMPQSLIAVDSEYASDDQVLGGATELGCIPPVSGG